MELHPFNPKIREVYGVTIDGRPKFRIARRMKEMRIPNTEDNPFLQKAVECKKYDYVPDEIWILEKLVVGVYNAELIESEKGSYEPLYVFWWDSSGPKDYSYKEPIWPAVKFLIDLSLNQKAQSASEAKQDDEDDFKRRRAECYASLDEASPWVPSLLKSGGAVVNQYVKEEPECSPSPSSSSSQE